ERTNRVSASAAFLIANCSFFILHSLSQHTRTRWHTVAYGTTRLALQRRQCLARVCGVREAVPVFSVAPRLPFSRLAWADDKTPAETPFRCGHRRSRRKWRPPGQRNGRPVRA